MIGEFSLQKESDRPEDRIARKIASYVLRVAYIDTT